MELTQTATRTIHQVVAEQDGWKLNASVTVQEGTVTNLDGYAQKDGAENVTFNAWMNGDRLTRGIHNVTDDSFGVYALVEEMISAIEEKYNN